MFEMMKIYIILFFLLHSISYAQDCKNFKEGVFELNGDFGTIIIERKGEWQLEKSIEYDIIYLNKIEYISECKFVIRYYKIIKEGIIPKPDTQAFATTEIIKVSNNEYFFESVFSNTESKMEGNYIKVSNEISDDFKKLIDKEGQSSD